MENKPINRIKVMLAERMISNKDLAEMLGKDPATISKWVTNTSQPSLENLIEIARCLKCEINDLVRLDSNRQWRKIRDYASKQERSITLPDSRPLL